MENQKSNFDCQEIKKQLITQIENLDCDELEKLEDIEILSINIHEEITEQEFIRIKKNYNDKFKTSILGYEGLVHHINNIDSEEIVSNNSKRAYLYFYFVRRNAVNTLALKFSDRDNLHNDFSSLSDEKIYIIDLNEKLKEINSEELEAFSEDYQRTFEAIVMQITNQSPTKYIRTEIKRLYEIGFWKNYITLHLVLESDNKINLATQINSRLMNSMSRKFYNKGALWP